MGAVADRLIRSTGTPESDWASLLADVPLLDIDAAMRERSRLVVVAPHPDDEILGCGGLIATRRAAQGRVSVVSVTDGEASHPHSRRWSPDALAQRRRLESEEGLRILGVAGDDITRLRFPDGQVARYIEPLRESLTLLLTRHDLVVSTWSLDGHPDHDAVGAATAQACAEVGAALVQAPVWMWHWSCEGDGRVPWAQLRRFPLEASTIDLKMRALAMHRTQLSVRSDTQGAVLDPLILQRARRDAEYFFVEP